MRRRETSKARRKAQRDQRNRYKIIKDARAVYREVFDSLAGGIVVVERAGCLYHTASLIYAASKNGLDLIPQAGTAAWPRICLDQDDGKMDTHFAYQWNGIEHPSTQAAIRAGGMPEMHVWAADVKGQAIVDITTKYLPEQCIKQARMEWTAPQPPDHLWAQTNEMPAGYFYKPNEDATRFVLQELVAAIHACGRVLSGKLPRGT